MIWPPWRRSARRRRAPKTDDPQPADAGWVDIAGLDDLQNNRLVVQLADISILILRTGRSVVAVENKCPHLSQPLADGQVSGRVIRCAAHGYSWDLTTGSPVPCPRGRWPGALRNLTVRMVDDRIELARPVPPSVVTYD